MKPPEGPFSTLRRSEILCAPSSTPRLCIADDGAAEALRWAGSLPALIRDFGVEAALDLHHLDAHYINEKALGAQRTSIIFISTFIWDAEALIVTAARQLGLVNVVVACSVAAAAHQCHPHAEELSPETGGEADFNDIASQLRSSIERMRKIDAQSRQSASSARQFSADVAVEILHLPLHCTFRLEGGIGVPEAISASPQPTLRTFTLNGSPCGDIWPLLRDAALNDLPRLERLRFRFLAHTIVDSLSGQLGLDVSGAVFTVGRTSGFLGPTVATFAETAAAARQNASFAGGGGSSGINGGAAASLLLVDRTLDLATPTTHGGSMLARMLAVLPRAGGGGGSGGGGGGGVTPAVGAGNARDREGQSSPRNCSTDFGVSLPRLAPSMGAAATGVAGGGSGTGGSGGGGGGGRPVRSRDESRAEKALSGFAWPLPPSICHPGDPAAAAAVMSLASLPEEAGHAELCAALRRLISAAGRPLPAAKKRGMGAAIMVLVTALAAAAGGGAGGAARAAQVCLRSRGVLAVALAAMEALQRTSGGSGGSSWLWDERAAAERLHLRMLRDGAGATELFAQLAESVAAGGVDSDAPLLLAARAAALAGAELTHADLVPLREALAAAAAAAAAAAGPGSLPPWAPLPPASSTGGPEEEEEKGAEEQAERRKLLLDDALDDIASSLLAVAAARAELSTPELTDLGGMAFPLSSEEEEEEEEADGGEDGWDVLDEDTPPGGDSVAAADGKVELDSLVGRLTALLLDPRRPEIPDVKHAAAVTAASVGRQMLSSLGLPGAARRRRHAADRPVLVVFVVGGISCHEVREVADLLRYWQSRGQGAATAQVVLAGTSVLTPDDVYGRVFAHGS